MHVQPSGDLLVDVVQGPFELERTMPRGQLRDDLAACRLQRGVQVGGAVAGIVVGGLLRGPWQQRQDRDAADQQPAPVARRAWDVAGIDPHQHTFTVAILDERGGLHGVGSFAISDQGLAAALAWLGDIGFDLDRVGVEGSAWLSNQVATFLAAGYDVREAALIVRGVLPRAVRSGRACALAQGAADQLELTGADRVHVAARLSADIGRLDQRIGQLDERIPAVRGRRQQAGVGGPVGVVERGRES
jgi:hypothetical protein